MATRSCVLRLDSVQGNSARVLCSFRTPTSISILFYKFYKTDSLTITPVINTWQNATTQADEEQRRTLRESEIKEKLQISQKL